MNKILCILPISINIFGNSKLNEKQESVINTRLEQFKKGIDKFIEFNEKYINSKKIEVILIDNTIDGGTLPKILLDIIPEKIKIITCLKNEYGSKNKGSGLIDQWIYLKKEIKNYDYLIHFEPRQLLINNNLISSFMKNNRNLFTINKNKRAPKNFNTGLFCINTKILINFINLYSPFYLFRNKISFEYLIYNYFNDNKIDFDTIDKMGLIRFVGCMGNKFKAIKM